MLIPSPLSSSWPVCLTTLISSSMQTKTGKNIFSFFNCYSLVYVSLDFAMQDSLVTGAKKKNYGSNNSSIKLPITCCSQMNISMTSCLRPCQCYTSHKKHTAWSFSYLYNPGLHEDFIWLWPELIFLYCEFRLQIPLLVYILINIA